MLDQIEFYYYANCTSCKKADAFLRAEGIAVVRRDFFKHRFTVSELKALLERHDLKVQTVLSTRSRPYLDLGLADRDLDENQLLELMTQHPGLLRRPLLFSKAGSLVGFNQEAYEALPGVLALVGKDAE